MTVLLFLPTREEGVLSLGIGVKLFTDEDANT